MNEADVVTLQHVVAGSTFAIAFVVGIAMSRSNFCTMGAVSDVAHAVAFLVDDASSYINGAVLPVDGGLGMGN